MKFSIEQVHLCSLALFVMNNRVIRDARNECADWLTWTKGPVKLSDVKVQLAGECPLP